MEVRAGMRLPTKEMRKHPLFAWLPEEGFETFEACFDMEAENLGAGERHRLRKLLVVCFHLDELI